MISLLSLCYDYLLLETLKHCQFAYIVNFVLILQLEHQCEVPLVTKLL